MIEEQSDESPLIAMSHAVAIRRRSLEYPDSVQTLPSFDQVLSTLHDPLQGGPYPWEAEAKRVINVLSRVTPDDHDVGLIVAAPSAGLSTLNLVKRSVEKGDRRIRPKLVIDLESSLFVAEAAIESNIEGPTALLMEEYGGAHALVIALSLLQNALADSVIIGEVNFSSLEEPASDATLFDLLFFARLTRASQCISAQLPRFREWSIEPCSDGSEITCLSFAELLRSWMTKSPTNNETVSVKNGSCSKLSIRHE